MARARRSTARQTVRPTNLWDDGYRLTFAEIEVETGPTDCAAALQNSRTLLWEDLDQAPAFPVLCSFIVDWCARHNGRLVSIKVTTLDGLTPDMPGMRTRSLSWH